YAVDTVSASPGSAAARAATSTAITSARARRQAGTALRFSHRRPGWRSLCAIVARNGTPGRRAPRVGPRGGADGGRSGAAGHPGLSGMQDARRAGQGRHGVEVRDVQAGVPDSGRHPGDAARRSDDRTVAPRRMRILLVRLRLLGDVVFTTPVIRGVRRRFPDAYIAYLVEEPAAPVVRGNPHLDEVIVARRPPGAARLFEDVRLGLMLRRRGFDLVLDLHGGPRASWITWLSGARERVGYAVAGRSWMYTRVVDRPRELRARHSVENQWDLLAALGADPPDPARDPLEMAEDPAAGARIEQRLRALHIPPGAPLVVLHVSAGNPFCRWPAAHFAQLAAGIVAADPARAVVLTAGPSDRRAAEAIGEQARGLPPDGLRERILRAGEFDLPELRALIGRAALFIGG